ncbi:M20/M25/M40 family metallo-hydrolase [Altererythrobacter arenosus]|uniref:M20/M25/M40 family metallo-hydrolase n=1 Tax=Altererythrobacter arenosus TaxID=3032592 RepID=A0ABY8FQF3_9SPHN|nr:M20/M25/M40 family metallo-hydrolase [Altererythrobacter sp. CAU 1644]WFL77244.1 M20/M25/M40 family metallo-hydrolase [Altererythrobacter sp. CAU 1644]
MRGLPGLLAFAALIATPAAAQLSPAEQVIVETVEAHHEADIALLERLVNQNSGTHNHAGVKAVADMLAPEFEALGFEVEWIDQSAAGRAGHLFARHEGKPSTTRMLLIGHLDTVFEPSSPFQTFVREGDRGIGPGAEDMKGGDVVILAALRAMKAAGTLQDANIVVAMTGDEEDAGDPLDAARADLIAAGEWADVALGFEALAKIDGRDMSSVARRSSNSWQLEATGKTGHSSGIFQEQVGYGAVYEMARILDAFRRKLPEENLTFNVGFMAGGTPAEVGEDGLSASTVGKTNIIPSKAVAKGDLRTLTQEQTDRIVAAMQAIVDQNLPGTDATISFDFRYPAMAPTQGNRDLLAKLNAINADLGLERMEEFPPSRRGAADISFVAPLVGAALAGMGADGAGGHAEGEYVDLPSMIRQAQRAAILMSRLSQEPRD